MDASDQCALHGEQQAAQPGDVLAVLLPDGTEGLVQCHVHEDSKKQFIRVDAIKPTGPFIRVWYAHRPGGPRSTLSQFVLPIFPDAERRWGRSSKNFRILTWEELQGLTIVPWYRDLDIERGAPYQPQYESEAGAVVAARNYLRDRGYVIVVALKPTPLKPHTSDIDFEHFQVARPGQGFQRWTWQEVVAHAVQMRNGRNSSAGFEIIKEEKHAQ